MIARKSDSLRAQEVLEAIFEMNERIKAFDITEDQFLHANDVRTRALADSLLMCALRVTEEAGKLLERSQRLHPEIEWRGIIGMRNYLAHDYGNVDRSVVWDAVTMEFPALERACRQIVSESERWLLATPACSHTFFERLIRFNPAETFFCDSICDIDQSKPARKKGERHEPAEHRLRTPLRRAA